MSNYYLCDTCGEPHWFDTIKSWWVCQSVPSLVSKHVIPDYKTPRSVCPHWKPKEKE